MLLPSRALVLTISQVTLSFSNDYQIVSKPYNHTDAMEQVPRILITIGIILVIIGLAWPLVQKIGLFRLPGDIAIQRENTSFYFPITTSIILSLVFTLILWLLSRGR